VLPTFSGIGDRLFSSLDHKQEESASYPIPFPTRRLISRSMKEISRASRGRQSRVKKPLVAPRRPFGTGQAIRDQLEEHLRGGEEIGDEEDEIDGDSQDELDEEEIVKREQQQSLLAHAGDVIGDHQHLHQHNHIDDGSHQHHQPGSDHHLQILAAANSLVNGAGSVLTHGADPSIHPALQGITTHHTFAPMDPPPAPQPQHHQGNPMQGHPVDQQVQHAPQHMHPQHHHQPAGRTAEQYARESGYPELTIDSALSKRLAREPGVRLAMQRRDEQQLNLKRRSNVEALLAHVSGTITASPCKNCHKGHGPWTSCVVVDGQMCGSCANCWYNASGARCSFHEVRNPQAQHQPAVLATTSPFNIQPMAAAAQALNQGMMAGGGNGMTSISYDGNVRFVVESAMQSIRNTNGDQRARLLARIETHARNLALSIQEYEDYMQSEEAAMSHQDVQATGPTAGSTGGDETMTEPGQ
jgi:hypothetical protein